MASPISSGYQLKEATDYDEGYLKSLKDQKDQFVKSINPKEMHKFIPMLSALSCYLESGSIMLIYKTIPGQVFHLEQAKINNRTHGIEFNDELGKLKNILSPWQMVLCNEICLTMLRGR